MENGLWGKTGGTVDGKRTVRRLFQMCGDGSLNQNGAAEDGEKWKDLRYTVEMELMAFASGLLVRWWGHWGQEEERAIQGFTLSSDVNSDAGYTDGKAWKGRFRVGPFWS